MVEAITLILSFGTIMFFVCKEIKEKDERDSRASWLSDLRECLHSIEREFSRECLDITKEALLKRDFTYDSCNRIRAIKNKYLDEVYDMVIKRKGQYFLKTIPDYAEREYERNLSEIADIYCDILDSQRQW